MTGAPRAQKPSGFGLLFTFRIFGRGWLEANLQSPTEQVRITASYLSDSLTLLLNALRRARADGTRSEATWAEEPGHYRWEISPRGAATHLRVFESGGSDDKPETVFFDYEGPTEIHELAVIDGCIELLDVMCEVRYFQQWGYLRP